MGDSTNFITENVIILIPPLKQNSKFSVTFFVVLKRCDIKLLFDIIVINYQLMSRIEYNVKNTGDRSCSHVSDVA